MTFISRIFDSGIICEFLNSRASNELIKKSYLKSGVFNISENFEFKRHRICENLRKLSSREHFRIHSICNDQVKLAANDIKAKLIVC